MILLLQSYRSLLADVANLSGFSEIRGSGFDLQWCLNEAPKLEKLLLSNIENGIKTDFSVFPRELQRLAHGSVINPILMRYLRQLLLFSYKAYVPHNNETELQALKAFDETNRSVREFGCSFSNCNPRLLNRVYKLTSSVLSEFRAKDIIPFHGPGASISPKDKWSMWFPQIEYCYPYSDYFLLYYDQEHNSELGPLTDEHIKAKIVAVPKDSRGPRLICVHPAESIWIQQGLRCELERVISRRFRRGPTWPCGHVNFSDQSINGKIALLSSASRKYSTIDLKEASDRLSDVLVQYLFTRYYKHFGCCRAQKYYSLNKSFTCSDDNIHAYAPMGNATTFPVQSLCFWAICVASLQSRGYHQPNSVFVFGDDILVPSECTPFILDDLRSFGLLPNVQKTFWKSGFRESCGVDAFNGVDVTPVRWKTSPESENTSDYLPLCDLAMRLRIAGYEETASLLYRHVSSRLATRSRKRLFYTNNRNHGSVSEYTDIDSKVWSNAYWHKSLHRFVSPTYSTRMTTLPRVLNGRNHLIESLSSLERTGHSNVPDRSAPRRTRLVRGWTDIC